MLYYSATMYRGHTLSNRFEAFDFANTESCMVTTCRDRAHNLVYNQVLFIYLKELAAADSLYFFSWTNLQQPTAIIFLVEQIGNGRQPLFLKWRNWLQPTGIIFSV